MSNKKRKRGTAERRRIRNSDPCQGGGGVEGEIRNSHVRPNLERGADRGKEPVKALLWGSRTNTYLGFRGTPVVRRTSSLIRDERMGRITFHTGGKRKWTTSGGSLDKNGVMEI